MVREWYKQAAPPRQLLAGNQAALNSSISTHITRRMSLCILLSSTRSQLTLSSGHDYSFKHCLKLAYYESMLPELAERWLVMFEFTVTYLAPVSIIVETWDKLDTFQQLRASTG